LLSKPSFPDCLSLEIIGTEAIILLSMQNLEDGGQKINDNWYYYEYVPLQAHNTAGEASTKTMRRRWTKLKNCSMKKYV
jgi:hypothetical protein